jgi:hypothetical protein
LRPAGERETKLGRRCPRRHGPLARLRLGRLGRAWFSSHGASVYFEDSPSRDLSPDWKFGITYNAVLKLCTILVYAEGWRPEKNLAHYRTLQALPLILGKERQADADYLDTCRSKRNTAEYDAPGQVSAKEAGELAAFARELREQVIEWLGKNHPQLNPWSG